MNICLKLCFVGIISAYNLITISDQYETGAPSDVCGDMMPQHNAEPLPLPSPYVISTDKKTIKPADNVAVKIDAKGGGNKTYFKGFLCLAKDTLNDTIGFFRPSRGAKLLNYADGQNVSCFVLVQYKSRYFIRLNYLLANITNGISV